MWLQEEEAVVGAVVQHVEAMEEVDHPHLHPLDSVTARAASMVHRRTPKEMAKETTGVY